MTLPPGLYGITDASQVTDPVAWGTSLVEAGCPTLQLRAKHWPKNEILAAAKALRVATRRAGATLIINDHPDIAASVEADGVHIGQDDLAVAEVRAIIGKGRLIGLSTHSLGQARTALGADYIGFGPLFQTQNRPIAHLPHRFDGLNAAVTASRLPPLLPQR